MVLMTQQIDFPREKLTSPATAYHEMCIWLQMLGLKQEYVEGSTTH